MYHSEEYLEDEDISFKYVIDVDEKKILADTTYDVINKYKTPFDTDTKKGSISYVESSIHLLQKMYDALHIFFTENPGDYFIRLNSCSPKDAWYQLCTETPDTVNSDEDESSKPLTVEDIRRDINVLKVNNAAQCIMVLCHSERTYFEFECAAYELSIILLPWRIDILHDTETRCFVKNKKLVAFTQYYADIVDGYQSILNCCTINDINNVVNKFIQQIALPYENAVIDIAFSFMPNDNLFDRLLFIEVNPFDENTDSVFFEWDDLFKIDETNVSPVTNPEFKYKKNGVICSTHN